jgi:tRNA1Val (adenine37-N6)-methyltransferase
MKRKTTKEILADSFLELAAEKRIDKITIAEITSNCSMSQPTFYNHFKDKYDLIVCNPPYFEDSLKSVGEQRTLARHNISLNFSDLINKVSNLISHEGNFCVVLPILGAAHFIQFAVEQGFYLNSRTDVQTVERKSPKRVLLSFSKKENPNPKFDKLVIQREGQYTQDFQDLTRDFYLNF